ncbi:GntR family transcriptional regulator [Mycolicibacterium rhodesiae]|uniref:GntR family transcriptional regulator n=1 Tax=Mycolicibacterium rhodesiae TaxID=36814 RepID=A0A1X0IV85_MYCRH|nr:GntR family transcriptional regulator [Mycolicibacterium rhodesiae]MCV7343373.1 GntR family transcriptional regulator [Mycolicibacterium rhodesiae]ORB52835.1 GntR family transcriptional regulator [Mycolicibacterium rhodesiae]
MSKVHLVRSGLDELLAGLQEGDPVPAERDLAVRFAVARDTVRQALHELLLEGRVQRRGRGTVVAKPKLVQPLSLKSYTEGAEQMGRKPGRILVAWEEVAATADLSAGLDVGLGLPVMHLERVLLADNERIGLESTYLPLPRFARLYDTFDPETSLYAAIRATGVQFASALERIETILPTPREAGLLLTTTAMPMLHLHRRSLDSEGRPIEVVRALYRGDRVAFQTVLVDGA